MADDFKLNIKAQVDVNDIKKQLREVSKTQKITFDANGIPKITQEFSKLKDTAGNAYLEMKKLDSEGNTLSTTFTRTASGAQTLGENFESMGRKLQSINGVFQAVKNVVVNFGQAMQPLLEFEDSLTEFKKVSDLSGEALDEYTKKLGQMGQEVGKSRAEMVDAATEFKKSGFDEADSAQLARIASLYQNIADEELNAGEAANFIISQIKAFNMTADDAMHIIDAINEVSNRTAVSSADLATNIGKASAALAAGGNTYEDVLALMTGIVEITRSGAKASRGLISIQSRYNQIIDESSSTGQKLSKWYKQHNIEIKNEEGQQRKLYDTLTDVSKIWNTLTKDEQLYYLNIQAGANQTQNLAAALSNFAQVQEAHQIALNSENSALDENARAMENLNKKIKAIKDSWAELVLAFANSEAIGDLLDRVNSALRSLAENEEAISTITKIAKALLIIKGFKIAGSLFSGAIGSAKDFLSVLKKIVSRLGDIGALFSLIKTEGLGATIAGLAPALATIAPYVAVFLGLGAAVGVLTGKFKELYNQHIAKTSDDLGKVANAYLNLIEAKKAYEGEQGTRYKTVTGQEALNEEIESLNKLINQYNQGKITISNFQKQVGDISQLEKYYNALQAMIDNNITLTSEQQNNYNALKKVLDGYNVINSSLETHREALKGLKEDVGKLNGVYKSSQSIYSVYKSSLQKIGKTYYFTSQAAKDSAIATQKAIIAEAESVIAQTENEIKAREQLAKVMSASSPTTSKLMKNVSSDMFSKTKLKSPDALAEDVASQSKDKWENVIATSQKAIAELSKIKVYSKGVGGGSGDGDGKGKKEKKDYLFIYKKRLEEYQKAQKDAYQKGEISASEYYSNVQKRGKSYYDKLKKMGSDYASDAKSMLDTYKQYNTTAVKDIFSEIEYRYKEGQIDGEKYYNELWKYAKKFYKNGKIDFDSYRDYIKKGYTALFDNLKKQYESGQLTAEQYQKKVDEAQKKSEKSIRQSVKSGALDKSMVKVTRNALVDAAYAAKNEVAKALKQAAIEAAEAAVEAAQKKLEEAQKRQDRANAFISALQFYADEQTEIIDKTIDGYNEQIAKLNEQLDLMDEQNEALDKQAERIKLVNALEEAKKQKTVRVYNSSLGWIWTADPKKVKDAQTALDDFDTARKREKEKQAIQEQIKALEALIKKKEDEKKAYQDVIDEQTKALNRYNIEAELGMTIEQAIFQGRTQNFTNWKNSYISGTQEVIAAIQAVNAAQKELDLANSALNNANNMVVPEWKPASTKTTDATYYYQETMSAQEIRNRAVQANIDQRRAEGYEVEVWYDAQGNLHYRASSTKTSKKKVKAGTADPLKKAGKKASGSLSLPKTGVYNVNELGDELMIPPTGNYDFLKKGTGIIPADLTKNLMDWGRINPKNLMGAQSSVITNDHSITIQNLTVQSDNAKDFVRQLQNLAIVRG